MQAALQTIGPVGSQASRSRLSRWAMVGVVTMVGVLVLAVPVSPAGATSTTTPKVSGFAASVTQVNGAGGSVTLTASGISRIGGGATCTLSVSPAIAGLPVSNDCSTLSWTATLPGNSTAKQISYKFTLTVVPTLFPTTPGIATTKVTSLVRSGAMYVALGDSYSSGEGNPALRDEAWVAASDSSS